MAIVVRINQDKMSAIVEIDRTVEEPVLLQSLVHALSEAGINHGVDDAACNEIIAAINAQPPGARLSGTVAHGTLPVPGEDGSVTMAVEYNRNLIGLPGQFGAIDFHERGSFTPIEKSQLIATIKLPTNGLPGKDVRGNELTTTPGVRASLTAGQGTKLETGGTELRAARHGDLRCTGDVIEVMDVIKVSGNLDYNVGSIECEGPVRVEGDVLPGFHIRAGGDVMVGGIVDAAEITTGGTLTVGQGVLGKSRICAKTKITVGYVRESYLECDGAVAILKEAVNSTIISGDSIVIPENGRVVGGRLLALKNIELGIAGSPKGIPTVLAAGVNPLKDMRAAKLASDIRRADAVQARIDRVKGLAKPDQHEVLDQLLSHAASKREIHAEELAALQTEQTQITACRIVVKKNVHSGVQIRIGRGDMTLQDERNNATFYFDAESGQVVQVTRA
ncbi:MAG TPA: FapA family protein [Terriglobia bacterium]|nr:FapA family protein [Terriglobia bacterium]